MSRIFDKLREPTVADVDVDTEDRLAVHQSVLAKKMLLQEVFTEFHHLFHQLDEHYFTADGLRIELGAGVAPVRETYPGVLATDIVAHPGLDQALDAQNMAIDNGAVRSLYGQNCFHHFPEPRRFFTEAVRVLAPGGGIILIEPYHGPLAASLYKKLFASEGFDKNYPDWEVPVSGPMNGANQALSYIVFDRDRKVFEEDFASLEIVHQETCKNHFKYLLSGGLNFRQLVPDWGISSARAFQWLMTPFNRWLALHHVIVIRKR